MKKNSYYILLQIFSVLLFSCSSAAPSIVDEKRVPDKLLLSEAGKVSESIQPEKSDDAVKKIKGYKEVLSIKKSYPGMISDITSEGDDVSFLVRNKRFFFSGGRLLPEEKMKQYENFRSYGFYLYPEKMPPLTPPGPEKLGMIVKFISSRGNTPRDNTFLGEIYSGHSLEDVLKEIRYINFLKFRIEVHRSLIHQFKAVEREILAEAEKDPELKSFIDSLEKSGAFNWRRANGSISRSYHSYGIAVDFTPASFGRKQVFWDWSRKFDDEWYNIPYSRRWMVNEKFVSAFEHQGFVWGGKWLFFDNMHFEYRPEILIFSGREVSGLAGQNQK